MCLSVPAEIIEIDGQTAKVSVMGNRQEVSLALLPDSVVGEHVLIHAGFAISLVDEEEAKETWQLIAEINNFNETQNRISG